MGTKISSVVSAVSFMGSAGMKLRAKYKYGADGNVVSPLNVNSPAKNDSYSSDCAASPFYLLVERDVC